MSPNHYITGIEPMTSSVLHWYRANDIIQHWYRANDIIITSSQVMKEWNTGELDSFLIEITADILAFKDKDGSPLVEKIRDAAGQKGTGKWTAISALDKGMPVTLIGGLLDHVIVMWFHKGAEWCKFQAPWHLPVRSYGCI